MPGPTPTPVRGDATLPARVDVVVVGAGIVGTSTALELAERGISVALCEKGFVGHEQSSRNWGWVRIACRDTRELPLMAEALRMWPGLDQRLGRPTGYTRSGIAFTFPNAKGRAAHEQYGADLAAYQIRAEMVSREDLAEMFPGSRLSAIGALHTPADGRAEPQLVAPAIAEGARDRGAAVLTECAVRGIETTAGRVSAVVTERGRIACDAVVLAGGAWSSLFARRSGLDLPQLKVMNSVLRTEPLDGPTTSVWHDDYAFRKRADGGYTVASGHGNVADLVPDSLRYATKFAGALRSEWRSLHFRLGRRFLDEWRDRTWSLDGPSPFERTRVLDPAPARSLSDRAFAALRRDFPVFAGARVAQSWAGYIDVTPDAIPVISPVDAVPGFHIATGFSGHGFAIGPAAGKLMADVVTGASPIVDPSPFRFSRFSDGSKITLVRGL